MKKFLFDDQTCGDAIAAYHAGGWEAVFSTIQRQVNNFVQDNSFDRAIIKSLGASIRKENEKRNQAALAGNQEEAVKYGDRMSGIQGAILDIASLKPDALLKRPPLRRKPVAVSVDVSRTTVITNDGSMFCLLHNKKMWQMMPPIPQPQQDE